MDWVCVETPVSFKSLWGLCKQTAAVTRVLRPPQDKQRGRPTPTAKWLLITKTLSEVLCSGLAWKAQCKLHRWSLSAWSPLSDSPSSQHPCTPPPGPAPAPRPIHIPHPVTPSDSALTRTGSHTALKYFHFEKCPAENWNGQLKPY